MITCPRCGDQNQEFNFIIDNTKNSLIVCIKCGWTIQTKDIIGQLVKIKIEV